MTSRATIFHLTCVLLLLVVATPAAHAQDTPPTASFDFRAVSSSITEGTTGVSTSTDLTFTLNKALPSDETLELVGIESLEDLLLENSGATVTGAALNGARTEITYSLALSPDTDYGIGFWGLRYDFDGDLTPPVDFTYVFQPYAVNFTTAASLGDASVEGELFIDPDVYPGVDPDFTDALVLVTDLNGETSYLDIVETTANTYTLPAVRGGSYLVTAFKFGVEYIADVPVIQQGVGFYDPNGDGVFDPLTVEAGATVTADIEMNNYFEEIGTAVDEQPEAIRPTLGASAPNPVQQSSTITFTLEEPQPVRLAVYDVLGREVAVLADGPRARGTHEVRFDAGSLSSGLYVYRLETPGYAQTRSLIVTR